MKILFFIRRNNKIIKYFNFFFCFLAIYLFAHSILPSLSVRDGEKQKLGVERKQ